MEYDASNQEIEFLIKLLNSTDLSNKAKKFLTEGLYNYQVEYLTKFIDKAKMSRLLVTNVNLVKSEYKKYFGYTIHGQDLLNKIDAVNIAKICEEIDKDEKRNIAIKYKTNKALLDTTICDMRELC